MIDVGIVMGGGHGPVGDGGAVGNPAPCGDFGGVWRANFVAIGIHIEQDGGIAPEENPPHVVRKTTSSGRFRRDLVEHIIAGNVDHVDVVELAREHAFAPKPLEQHGLAREVLVHDLDRALADDVTDTLLTVACNNGGAIGDGVDANDKAFTTTFPYLASPHSGNP